MKPLAERLRPKNIDDVIGQKHILGKGKPLYNMIKNNKIMNMIFYGPPGIGKTTTANIIANSIDKKLYKLNATNASVSDIQKIVKSLDTFIGYKGVVLYLDEIQNFNKKQQQSLLEYIEDGRITLIASTAENPYHCIYSAILSRSIVFEFKPPEEGEIVSALERAVKVIKLEDNIDIVLEDDVLKCIAGMCSGDVRKAINFFELAVYFKNDNLQNKIHLTVQDIEELIQEKGFNFDKNGDYYYDSISAFQKSIRGSDADAAIYYTAVLIKGGHLREICRRLLVIASEDIGLAYPQAASIVYSLVQSALYIGLPEARIPISQAVILLATSPKSNSVVKAIDEAISDIENGKLGEVPSHLRDAHYTGSKKLGRGVNYKYPHMYENNYVYQQYIPDKLKNKIYYVPGKNKMEIAADNYMKRIKGNHKNNVQNS
ncbi:replication-associated recombination protein A [Clostridium tyrobutyricum]|uniref:replication-associated recombination protein A n=1 Tax=Clostridium tyrobutyricum TaxID=1519 RepID=UPI00057D41CE|nr:replication-associated recombination protein A [Clostridium tyrobutyricum]